MEYEKTFPWADSEMWQLGPYRIIPVQSGRAYALPGGAVIRQDEMQAIAARQSWAIRPPITRREP